MNALMMAISGTLRPLSGTITLSGTLPAPTVGTAYSGSVTATLVDGATGTLTITVDQLPAGLALGATTNNGDGTFTAPVTGTPTTQQTITSTFNATGGSVNATPLAHQFVVGVASPVLVQQIVVAGNFTTSNTLAFKQAVTAGNTLLLGAHSTSTATFTAPSGWSLIRSQAISGDSGGGTIDYYQRTSDGTETGVSGSWSGAIKSNSLFVQEYEGAVQFGTSMASKYTASGAQVTIGPTDAPPNSGAIPALFVMEFFQTTSASAPSPWITAYASGGANNNSALIMSEPAPNAAVTVTVAYSGTPSSAPQAGNLWVYI